MDPKFGREFRSALPAIATGPLTPGQAVFDEGVFVCIACGLSGSEVSLLPGDEAPECPHCAEGARWVKT